MNRQTWNEFHMMQAQLMAQRSTCAKMSVGAVLIKNTRTVSQGYNGVGPGCEHCCDIWKKIYNDEHTGEFKTYESFLKSEFFLIQHKIWACQNELHAEQNCILWAAREGISTQNTTLYTTYSPCISCSKVILMAGIVQVYYLYEYENDVSGISYLKKNNIGVDKVSLG
jgi:dCMP deaminase